jgi:hypothetical protein
MTVIAPVKQSDLRLQDLHPASIEITDAHTPLDQVIGHLRYVSVTKAKQLLTLLFTVLANVFTMRAIIN